MLAHRTDSNKLGKNPAYHLKECLFDYIEQKHRPTIEHMGSAVDSGSVDELVVRLQAIGRQDATPV